MTMHLPIAQPQNRGGRFEQRAQRVTGAPLRATTLTTLQVNVGKVCNQACKHCHVDAGPARTESMDAATTALWLDLVRRHRFPIVDITGGAPELNPHFREMVTGARALGAHVMVRHNLTVMEEEGQHDLADFFAANDVEVVSSLPHYTAEATDRQRGAGVFEKSLRAMRALNAKGYGAGAANRRFGLVYNPVGAFLPGSQRDLERDYKHQLSSRHGVHFDQLYTITNMPIQRYKAWLERSGQLDSYQAKLESVFNPATLAGLMCRSMISLSWDGKLYDCDFNQMLDLRVLSESSTLSTFDREALEARVIATGDHCFGCTAGAGSSCGGAIT